MDDDFSFLFGAPPKPKTKAKKNTTTTTSSTTTTTNNPSDNNEQQQQQVRKKMKSKTITNLNESNTPLLPPTKPNKALKAVLGQELSDDEDHDKGETPTTESTITTTTTTEDKKETTMVISKAPTQIRSFSQLGVSSWLISTLSKLRIVIPTEIQLKTIPSILRGDNVIARAKTGSGKTAAFALPILENLSRDQYGIYAIVMTPTHELALQIKEQFDVFGSVMGLNTLCVIGGVDMVKQAQALENRPHIVIATPGRLSDLLVRGSVQNFGAKQLKYLVLDEADRLFDDCFIPFLDTILDYIPPLSERQTILVSATLTADLIKSHSKHPLYDRLIVQSPVYHASADENDNVVENLTQSYVLPKIASKEAYLNYILQFANPNAGNLNGDNDDIDGDHRSRAFKLNKRRHDGSSSYNNNKQDDENDTKNKKPTIPHPTRHHESCIVFTTSVKTAQYLSMFLTEMGIGNVPLHSKVKQSDRLANLNRFRAGRVKVLVATDVAARGLDIPQVTLVINYDWPYKEQFSQNYIHRVGRTARANRHGIALTMLTRQDDPNLQRLYEEAGVKLTEFPIAPEQASTNIKMVNEKKHYVRAIIEEQEEKEAAQYGR